jgi:hypothetical protein
MANVLVNEKTLKAIADAVRARGGTSALMKPGEIPDAVSKIPSGGSGADMSLPVRFFDYEGTLLYSFSLEELARLECLPDLSFHEGLVCTGWNWTLENLKKTNREMNVSAQYVTDDGATRIYVSLDKDTLEPQVSFGQSEDYGVKVDWGDGSEPETAEGWNYTKITLTHRYREPGEYVIRFLPQGENQVSFFGSYNSGSYAFTAGKSNVRENMKYLSAVRKIEAGSQIRELGDYCFSSFSRLESLTMGKAIEWGNGVVKECYSLRFLGLPEGKEMLSGYFCDGCVQMEHISVPNTITQIGDYVFDKCSALQTVTLPDGVTDIGRHVFESCCCMTEMVLPSMLKRIGGQIFQGCRMLEKVVIPDGIDEIVDSMFSGCYTLTEIVIPKSVTMVSRYSFENCQCMKRYYFLSDLPPELATTGTFLGLPKDCKLYVLKGKLDVYQTAESWSDYASYMVEMEGDIL